MQIDETVHGCPVAVVHLIVRLEILALQVKSGPPRGNRLWLRPQAALWKKRAVLKRSKADTKMKDPDQRRLAIKGRHRPASAGLF